MSKLISNEDFLSFQLEERLKANPAELARYHIWWTEMSKAFREMSPEMANLVCDLVARAHSDLTTKQELLDWVAEGT